jgi:cytochrome c oxidase cbb3-type subunit 3
MISRKHFLIAFLAGSALTVLALAQAPAAGGRGGRGGRGGAAGASGGAARGGRAGGFTQFTRPLASQDVVARGKTLFEANCASCHASDFRGTPKGVNIVRSGIALRDQHGELIGEELGKHNPPITLVAADNVATAEYIHAMLATAGRQGRPLGGDPSGLELNVLVGDVNAGKTYFGAHCASCHSITGDMQGIGTRYADNPRGLQGDWVAGTGGGGGRGGGRGGRGGGGGQQATVTLANGQKVQGTLVKRTDFLVVMTLPDGTRKEWTRVNDIPSVDVVDPQAAHKKMVLEMDDPENKNMHDVTAYLATLK